MRQANKEARATVAALACIIVVWLVGGFGLAGTDIWVFHTPLWVIGGCVAPWIAAVVAAVVLSRRVFADFDLDEVAGSCPASMHLVELVALIPLLVMVSRRSRVRLAATPPMRTRAVSSNG